MSGCDHVWKEEIDAVVEVELWHAGQKYRPATEICTKCQMRRKIKYQDESKWYVDLLLFPIIMISGLILVTLLPFLLLIYVIEKFLFVL